MRRVVLLVLLGGCQALFRLDHVPGGTPDALGSGSGDAGGCSLFQPHVDYVAAGSPGALTVVDLDSDQRPDVVLGDTVTSSVQVFHDTGTGFDPRSPFATTIAPFVMASGQLTGDQAPDLVITDRTSQVEIVPNNGALTVVNGNTYVVTSPVGVAVGDFDASGTQDIVTTDGLDSVVHGFTGNGNGSLTAASSVGVGATPSVIATTNVDGDNYADFVVVDTGITGYTVVSGRQFIATTGTLADFPSDVRTADLDNDGMADFVFSLPGTNQIQAVLGKSPGTQHLSTTADHAPAFLAVADFDHDGKPDVIVYDPNLTALIELAGNGDGTFGDGTRKSEHVITLPGPAGAFGVADFNGDQEPDLAIAIGGGAPSLSIFLSCP